MRYCRFSEKGSALIAVLLIVAIVTVIAAGLASRFHGLIRYDIRATEKEKLLFALQGIQDWGLAELQQLPPKKMNSGLIHYHGIELHGQLDDQQGKFNLNDLRYKTQQPRFVRLVQVVDPKIDRQKAAFIAANITAKLQQKNSVGLFLRASEIQSIPGITPSLYHALRPYITALPTASLLPINVNTASAPVLMTLSLSLSVDQANSLVICVKKQGEFLKLSDYNAKCLQPLVLDPLANSTTQSAYYVVNGQAKIGSQQLRLSRLLFLKNVQNNKIEATVLWQTIE